MAVNSITIRMSEKRYAFVKLTPASGTLRLSSATVTLYQADEVAGGLDGSLATGITAGESSGPKAWYLFSPTDLNLEPGSYVLAFLVTDTAGVVYEPVLLVVVLPDYAP